MVKTSPEQAMRELTMMLIYLSRFTQNERFGNTENLCAWKGYDYDILNKLCDDDCIYQGEHPSRSKKLYITDSGIEHAKELLNKYGIEDWNR